MQRKLRLARPVTVEGKYDKIKLSSIVESEIIALNGFGIFKDEKKRQMLKSIADKHGLIVLTDSDGGGLVIRNHLRSLIPKEQMIHIYIPKIEGKEGRKTERSKEGFLGVEGMEKELLFKLLEPYSIENAVENGAKNDIKVHEKRRKVTKTDLFCDGFSGGEGSSSRRKALCEYCSLPDNISPSALLEAINLLYTYDEYKEIINKLKLI